MKEGNFNVGLCAPLDRWCGNLNENECNKYNS